jgi:hypothetical protein
MANLKSIAEQAWRQLGGGTDESRLTFEEVLETAKNEYAWQMLQWVWRTKREDGSFDVPGHLATQSKELPVINNEIDISNLKILKALPDDRWVLNIGGLTCGCRYVKSTVNQSQLMCEDDSLDDTDKTFIVVNNKIIFPRGTHAKKLPIIYTHNGSSIEEPDVIEVEDSIGGIVRQRLIEIYAGKTAPEDKTNNTNPNV